MFVLERVWVFNGAQSRFPSGAFASREAAESWIRGHSLTGVLTEYPLNVGMYEYAIEHGTFTPKKEAHTTPLFIGRFSGGGIDHFHFEDGVACSAETA
ncbi:MAG: hypothetical protein QM757_34965 [Paludibaculum sp.]